MQENLCPELRNAKLTNENMQRKEKLFGWNLYLCKSW